MGTLQCHTTEVNLRLYIIGVSLPCSSGVRLRPCIMGRSLGHPNGVRLVLHPICMSSNIYQLSKVRTAPNVHVQRHLS